MALPGSLLNSKYMSALLIMQAQRRYLEADTVQEESSRDNADYVVAVT